MKEERTSFIASDGIEISYVDIGEGIPFLWIHGWGGNAERQSVILRGLSKSGFRGLCFDQRGCGKTTSMKNISVAQSAQDAKELLEHLGIDNAVMLGYSMGAAVLFSYLEQFGTEHLSKIIIGEMTPKPLNDEKWKFGLYQGWYKKENLEQDIRNMEHSYKDFAIFFAEQTIFQHTPNEPRDFQVTPKYVEQVYQRAERENKLDLLNHLMIVPDENALANRIYWESCDSHDYRPAIERIDVPTALFYAKPGSIYDPHVAYWMAAQIPDVSLYCFEDCTHMASSEKPELFIERIIEFAKKS